MSDPETMADAALDIGPVQEIPDKLYFRIGDVARLAGIKPYVLRFWESEFKTLGPKKSGTGHRLYRRKDVEQVLEIKRLLYEQRFTIEGARKHLESKARADAAEPAAARAARAANKKKAPKLPQGQGGLFDAPGPSMETVRAELQEILKLLK